MQTSSNTYTINIGDDLLANLMQLNIIQSLNPTKILIITDDTVQQLYANKVKDGLLAYYKEVYIYSVKNGELSKSLHDYEQIIGYMLNNNFDRKSIIITLGGGVVGDLGGFVAATYMRGIPFIQMPTTILAHDSSVGGKVAINHELGKNTIGAFYQPQAVIYDVSTIKTLPDVEIKSGIAEVVKHGHIHSPQLIAWLEKNYHKLQQLDNKTIAEMLYISCKVKAEIVAVDEKEKGIRAFLNFGHTIAHGIESSIGYGNIAHGLAVAIGMVTAAILGYQKGITPHSVMEHIISINKLLDLPIQIPVSLEHQKIIDYIMHDKKNIGGSLTFVLLQDVGSPIIVKDISISEVLLALEIQQTIA